jgi:phosphate transport system permease protein
LVLLFGALVVEGIERIDWQFLTSFPSRRAAQAGILPALVGTSLIMLVTAVVGIPLGVAAAIYLEEYARRTWVTELIEVTVTNLAGVPSIIFGLLALGLFVYIMGLGASILTAGLTLALLILPVVIVTTREAIRAIPVQIREAAYALGATKWQTVSHHVVPYSAAGILTGIILALSRAIGETAPIVTIGALTFIAFLPSSPFTTQPPFISFDWLMSPFTVMPIQMFAWVSRPGEDFASNAAAAGLLLICMTLAMNGLAIYVRYRMRKRIAW